MLDFPSPSLPSVHRERVPRQCACGVHFFSSLTLAPRCDKCSLDYLLQTKERALERGGMTEPQAVYFDRQGEALARRVAASEAALVALAKRRAIERRQRRYTRAVGLFLLVGGLYFGWVCWVQGV